MYFLRLHATPARQVVVDALFGVSLPDLVCTLVQICFGHHAYDRHEQLRNRRKIGKLVWRGFYETSRFLWVALKQNKREIVDTAKQTRRLHFSVENIRKW